MVIPSKKRPRPSVRAMQASRADWLQLGCAGWSLPRPQWDAFDAGDSHLERYASRLRAVEINSSFYRPHQRATYQRWATGTPPDFRFSVKVPKTLTHELRLENAMPAFDGFLAQVAGLGPKLGALLLQLPPSLAFDEARVHAFLAAARKRYDGLLALEPRHASWFTLPAERLLSDWWVGRVLADPVLHPPLACAPGGWPGLVYLRLHGSPRRYWSSYGDALLQRLADRLRIVRGQGTACWCIFDNTAAGEATANALTLARLLS